MTRTPDEIKRNIVACMELNVEKFMPGATQKALDDALALIQQLQAENAEKDEKIRVLEARVQQLEAERDAMMHWAKGRCDTCAHKDDCVKHDPDPAGYVIRWYDDCEIWEWRGVQKEDGNGEA